MGWPWKVSVRMVIWAKTWRRWEPCKYLGQEIKDSGWCCPGLCDYEQGGQHGCSSKQRHHRWCIQRGKDTVFTNSGCFGTLSHITGYNPSLCPLFPSRITVFQCIWENSLCLSAFSPDMQEPASFLSPPHRLPCTLFLVALAVGISIPYWFDAAPSALVSGDESALLQAGANALWYSPAPMA